MSIPTSKSTHAEIHAAAQLFRKGRKAEAFLAYERIAKQAGDDPAVNRQLGLLCTEFGRLDDAIAHLRVAVENDPDNAQNLSDLGVALHQDFQFDEAYDVFERSVSLDDEMMLAHHGLGAILMHRQDFAAARAPLERAHKLKPKDASVRTNLALTLAHLNEHELALEHAEKALAQDRSSAAAHYAKGRILTELGRTDDALRFLTATIRRHPEFGGAYDLLARLKKFSAEDEPFIRMTERALEQSMPANERRGLHSSLGKMYDDCRNYEQAYEHYRRANILQKKPYDIRRDYKRLKQSRKIFNKEFIRERQAHGHKSDEPVFVVGMPRSGTTLIERLIAAHPRGAGAGELPDIQRIANEFMPHDNLTRASSFVRERLTSEAIREAGEEYLVALRRGHVGAERIVDKMPGNYADLGLITVLFPNARIIHAKRNPLDSCLSCYFQNFAQIRWANDFAVIGEVYRIYQEFMAHWHKVLPEGKIIEIQYEDLIEDPETHGRRLLEGCGLSWDAKSLEFYRQKGIVKTASLWQVRQPIYKTSRRRWMNYAPYIGELANALAPYLQDDRALLAEHGITLDSGGRGGWLKRMFG